jgi:Glycosyltransferase family 92
MYRSFRAWFFAGCMLCTVNFPLECAAQPPTFLPPGFPAPITRHALGVGTHVALDWVQLPIKEDWCKPHENVSTPRPLVKPPCEQPLSSFCPLDHCRDSVRISLCNDSLIGSNSVPLEGTGIAVCTPVLAGRLNTEWLFSWAEACAALRSSQLTIYADGIMNPWVSVTATAPRIAYEWLDVSSWMSYISAWQHGQLWAMHDCLYRNTARGLRWALFIDVDEVPVLPSFLPSLPDLTQWLERRNFSGASFGSVRYLSAVCGNRGDLFNRTHFRAVKAECQDNTNHEACPDWKGRRKSLVRLGSFTVLSIHNIEFIDGTVVHLNASLTWLKHVRGAAFAATLCAGDDMCTYLDGVSISCPEKNGLNGGPLFTNTSASPLREESVLSASANLVVGEKRGTRWESCPSSIIHNGLHELSLLGDRVGADMKHPSKPSDYNTLRYSIGDYFNMPVFGGSHVYEKFAEVSARAVADRLPDSILAYYFNEPEPPELPRIPPNRTHYPNLQQVVNSVNRWGADHSSELAPHVVALKENRTLAVHIRSGDKKSTSPAHVNAVINISSQFSTVYLFGGIHNDSHQLEVSKVTLEIVENLLQHDVSTIASRLRAGGKRVVVLDRLSPDAALYLMGRASNLMVHRGGFSALGALVCGRNNGTVFHSDSLAYHWVSEELRSYIRSSVYVPCGDPPW